MAKAAYEYFPIAGQSRKSTHRKFSFVYFSQ